MNSQRTGYLLYVLKRTHKMFLQMNSHCCVLNNPFLDRWLLSERSAQDCEKSIICHQVFFFNPRIYSHFLPIQIIYIYVCVCLEYYHSSKQYLPEYFCLIANIVNRLIYFLSFGELQPCPYKYCVC